MKLPRRQFLHLAAGAAALPMLSHRTAAQAFPARPVRVIVQVPAGSAPDIVARVIGEWLSQRLGQPIVIDNRPGASGNIATEAVVRAAPDGTTLLFCMSANAINATLYDNLRFSFVRDTAPVALIGRIPLVMEVHPSVPAKTVAEFIAYAKANPGKINIGSFGVGSTSHVAGELFKTMTGIGMTHVPYRGGAPMVADLIAGHIQAAIDVMTGSLAHIKSGAVRALAVAGKSRYPGLPDVPTIGETIPLYVANSWCGVGVPKGTPNPIIERLNSAINAELTSGEMKAVLARLGADVRAGTPEEFAAFVAAEAPKWAAVIKSSGMKLE